MNKTYDRILNLVVEDQGMKAHGERVRAAKLRKQHGVTPDEISGKVTTHRSGAKLKWGRTGTQGQSGFTRTK